MIEKGAEQERERLKRKGVEARRQSGGKEERAERRTEVEGERDTRTGNRKGKEGKNV